MSKFKENGKTEKYRIIKTEVDKFLFTTKDAFIHTKVEGPIKIIGNMMQQYYLKNPIRVANSILNNEFVKEISFYHLPESRGTTLFKIGEKDNIFHFPKYVKNQDISLRNFKKYFIVEINKEGVKIRIVKWILAENNWKDVLSMFIPRKELYGTAIIRKEKDINDKCITSLILPANITPHFIFKEDIYEKYKIFKKW